MKKLLASLMALMCLTSMAACAGEKPAPEPEESTEVEVSEDDGIIIADVKKTGVLKVGVWGNSPTFSFHKLVDGKDTMAGFEIEFVKELAVRLGEEIGREVTIEYTEGTLTGMFAALQAGQLHFICELAPTAERMESWQFTKPYHRSNLCFIARTDEADDPKFDPEGGLKGVSIAVGMGSIDATMARFLYPEANVVEYEDAPILAVANGRADLACMNAVTASMYVRSNNGKLVILDDLTYVPTDEFDPGCGLCMQKGNDDFVEFANAYIDQVRGDGTFDRWVDEALDDLDEVILDEYKTE